MFLENPYKESFLKSGWGMPPGARYSGQGATETNLWRALGELIFQSNSIQFNSIPINSGRIDFFPPSAQRQDRKG